MATRRKPPAAAWKPGQSGNPKGRPAGTGEVAKLRAAIADRVPELLAAMMARALDGDVGAARLLLERAIAPLKAAEQPQALSLPDGTLTDQGRAVLAAVAAGGRGGYAHRHGPVGARGAPAACAGQCATPRAGAAASVYQAVAAAQDGVESAALRDTEHLYRGGR